MKNNYWQEVVAREQLHPTQFKCVLHQIRLVSTGVPTCAMILLKTGILHSPWQGNIHRTWYGGCRAWKTAPCTPILNPPSNRFHNDSRSNKVLYSSKMIVFQAFFWILWIVSWAIISLKESDCMERVALEKLHRYKSASYLGLPLCSTFYGPGSEHLACTFVWSFSSLVLENPYVKDMDIRCSWKFWALTSALSNELLISSIDATFGKLLVKMAWCSISCIFVDFVQKWVTSQCKEWRSVEIRCRYMNPKLKTCAVSFCIQVTNSQGHFTLGSENSPMGRFVVLCALVLWYGSFEMMACVWISLPQSHSQPHIENIDIFK